MPQCVVLKTNDVVKAVANTVDTCTGFVMVDPLEYQTMIQNQPVSAVDIGLSFTWGFSTYIFFWWLGYVVKNARQVIRKA